MRWPSLALLASLALTASAGCNSSGGAGAGACDGSPCRGDGGNPGPIDGGGAQDGGASQDDGGAALDGGSSVADGGGASNDGGPALDGGSPLPDGGAALDGGSSARDGGAVTVGVLRISPSDYALELPSGTSRPIEYRVFDGQNRDVTGSTQLTIDITELGTFSANILTTSATRGGVARIQASAPNAAGETTLRITRPRDDVILTGAGADAPGRFGGTVDAARAPTIVYPADGTILPPNLPSFEVHFLPGTGNTLFDVAFVGTTSEVHIYTPCTPVGGGCVLTLDTLTFSEVGLAAASTGEVMLRVRGTSGSGGAVGASPQRKLGVTANELRGGIYYWAAAAGSIMRYEFGRTGARVETYLSGTPFNCVGCHVLSRDGTRISVGQFIPSPAQTKIYDVVTRRAASAAFGANFGSFSPDNQRLLVSDGVRMTLLDGTLGRAATGLPTNTLGSMPDWSPDGRYVVFSRTRGTTVPFGGSPGHGAPADLKLMPYVDGGFGSPTTLVSASAENNYYPSFSPDGQWILFNRSASDSYNVIDATLWLVGVNGGAPTALSTANGSGDLGNSWPKWAPFAETYQTQPLMWITWSSRRDYGLRLQQQSATADRRISQLWMAAVRPGQAGDPSAPGFWLPFQDLGAGNHIAQWTTEVRRASCNIDSECGVTDICVKHVCVGR